jgi:ribosome-binding ATPase YchF (GTP1/OBG family)
VKIGIFGIEGITQGKANIMDARIKSLEEMFKSAKRVYIQADIITAEDKIKEADGIIALESAKLVLIMTDLEFVELRLQRSLDEAEKKLLSRFKSELDKERMLFDLALDEEEKKAISGYPLLTVKPIYFAKEEEAKDKDKLLFSAYNSFGYITYFTAGEKDAHAWSIKKGATAWEASGAIHSDIQKGFIRAEVVSFQDLMNDGGFSGARNNNHLRLEMKEYIVQDGDVITFRVNK